MISHRFLWLAAGAALALAALPVEASRRMPPSRAAAANQVTTAAAVRYRPGASTTRSKASKTKQQQLPRQQYRQRRPFLLSLVQTKTKPPQRGSTTEKEKDPLDDDAKRTTVLDETARSLLSNDDDDEDDEDVDGQLSWNQGFGQDCPVLSSDDEAEFSHSTMTTTSHKDTDDGFVDTQNVHSLLQIPCALQKKGPEDLYMYGLEEGVVANNHKRIPMTTIVDTGAQVTVLSYEGALKAGVLGHLDRRYAGHATGVGNCRVLGRIPGGSLLLHLHGDQLTVPCPPILVLEKMQTGVELLLGLDFLRDTKATLNLSRDEMKLVHEGSGSSGLPVVIPFLKSRARSMWTKKNTDLEDNYHRAKDDDDGGDYFNLDDDGDDNRASYNQNDDYLQDSDDDFFLNDSDDGGLDMSGV